MPLPGCAPIKCAHTMHTHCTHAAHAPVLARWSLPFQQGREVGGCPRRQGEAACPPVCAFEAGGRVGGRGAVAVVAPGPVSWAMPHLAVQAPHCTSGAWSLVGARGRGWCHYKDGRSLGVGTLLLARGLGSRVSTCGAAPASVHDPAAPGLLPAGWMAGWTRKSLVTSWRQPHKGIQD